MTQDRPSNPRLPANTAPGSTTSDSARPGLHLTLLGGMHVTWQGENVPVTAPRMLGLLAYLHRQGAVPRKELELMFWPGQGANAVRQGLYTLRRLPGADQWLQDGPLVSLHASSDLQDALQFLQDGQDAQALQLLAQGPLLEHLNVSGNVEFNDWLDAQRRELHDTRRGALRREAERLTNLGNLEAARNHLNTLLTLDPLDEPTWRDLMRLEGQAGHPEAALDTFENLRRTLHAELHIEPDAETLALLHELEGHEISGQTRARLLNPAQELNLEPLSGRQDEQQNALHRLQEHRRALIQGMAGMGKTRLAWAVAEHHLHAGQRVLWLELGGDPPEVLLPALTDALGLKQTPPRQDPRPLHAALHDKQVALIVLDNAANTYALSVLLEYLPATLNVLITSRLRLPRLSPLTLHRLPRHDALQLISHHTQELQPPPDPYTLDALCALLGDHPYALRLAAITLAQGHRTPRELLGALTDAPHTLGAEHSITTLLQQSLAALDADSYEAYLGLGSLFTPQTTPELLALALRRDPDSVERALYTLTQHGLTTRDAQQGSDTVTFRMHELTWHDAKAHAALQARTIVQAVRQYAHANTATPENLYAELPNLVSAAQFAERHDPSALIQIMQAWLNNEYVGARGFPIGYLHLLTKSMALAEQDEAWEAASTFAGYLGHISAEVQDDRETAIRLYLQAAEFSERQYNMDRQVRFISLAGFLQAKLQLPEAEKTLELALNLLDRVDNPVIRARVLEQQGIFWAMHKNFEKALISLQSAYELLKQRMNPDAPYYNDVRSNYINIANNLGQVNVRLGRLNTALELKRESLRMALECDQQVRAATEYLSISEVLVALGEHEQAREAMLAALSLYRQFGMTAREADVRARLRDLDMDLTPH